MLALVFVPGIGRSNYGATRWIGIGSVTIQPSELAKYGFVIFASAYMSEHMDAMRTFKGMLPVLAAGGAVCALIILEPNMSVTMCVGLLMLAMIFLGGMKMRWFLVILVPALVAVPVLILMEPYRLLRLSAFLDPWASPKDEGYQLIQSLYALGNGGWFGTGLFRSRQKYRFLPFAESDFILSVIGEEFGFVGIFSCFCCAGFSSGRAYARRRNRTTFFLPSRLRDYACLRNSDDRQRSRGERFHSADGVAVAADQFRKHIAGDHDGIDGDSVRNFKAQRHGARGEIGKNHKM